MVVVFVGHLHFDSSPVRLLVANSHLLDGIVLIGVPVGS